MTRCAAVLTVLAVLLAALGAPTAAAAPEASGRSLNHVAVIGDSYTTGSTEGGQGPNGWAPRVWQSLTTQGYRLAPDVAAEGGAGYAVRGNRGSLFGDLTPRAVRPDDTLVVFFGSRNDLHADPKVVAANAGAAFALARRTAPGARLLVIGPPWTGADVPPDVLRIRDALHAQALAQGAAFYDPLIAGWFFGTPWLIGHDGVHPTDAGHAFLADRIAPLIAGQLSRPV